MSRVKDKRKVELVAIRDWIAEGSSVLDLGCGRGILLAELVRTKNIYAVGVDSDFDKVSRAVKRGISIMHDDILSALKSFDDKSFDWVVCSRTLPELENAKAVINEALRVGNKLAVAFINYGFWLNRLNVFLKGSRVSNEVYPNSWYNAVPSNNISIASFKEFCKDNDIKIKKQHFLKGDWKSQCKFMPNLLAGYAIFELEN
ncbi:MAG: methionine biosynthesis protein MetW [Opitutales bacterium]